MSTTRYVALAATLALLACGKENTEAVKADPPGAADKPATQPASGPSTPKHDPSDKPAAAIAPSATTPPAVTASASAPSSSVAAATTPPPCTVDSTTTLDHGALAATGLTTVKIAHGQAAIGYAVAPGTPRVLVVDRKDGTTSLPEIAYGHLRDQEKVGEHMVRVIHRVTPLGMKDRKMRVGVDLIDTSTEKNKARYVRCGPADSEPIEADDTPLNFFDVTEDDVAKLPADAVDMRDCRTFSNGEMSWVVATVVHRASTSNHDIRVAQLIDDKIGKATIADPELDHRDLKPGKDKKYATLDQPFATPVSAHAGMDGYVIVARDGANLLFAHRKNTLQAGRGAATIAPGTAPGFPSITHEGERVFLAHTGWGRNDVYASTFLGSAQPVKPVPVALVDSTPPTQGMRDTVSLFPASDGSLFVTFIDDKTNKSGRARLTILTPELKQRISDVIDVSAPDVQAIESRVVSLSPNKAFVATLTAKGDVLGSMVTCK